MNISLTGMMAAQTRLAASASNVANANSTSTIRDGKETDEAYQAVRVEQTSQAEGGTKAAVKPANPATYPAFDSTQNAVIDFPNVDLATETVNQIQAVNAYKASAQAFEIQKEAEDSFLNITS